MEVEGGSVDRAMSPRRVRQGASGRAVDASAVPAHPIPDLLQRSDAGRGDGSIPHGSDIEQVIAALTDDFDQPLDHVARALPLLIEFAVAPRGVQGLGCFPVFFETSGRHPVVIHILVIAHEFTTVIPYA